jgi:hypothetical protein
MNTATLKRQRKDDLIEMLLETTKEKTELDERTPGTFLIGLIAGTILGIALARL